MVCMRLWIMRSEEERRKKKLTTCGFVLRSKCKTESSALVYVHYNRLRLPMSLKWAMVVNYGGENGATRNRYYDYKRLNPVRWQKMK